jgi:hypothetical protein
MPAETAACRGTPLKIRSPIGCRRRIGGTNAAALSRDRQF